MIYNVSGVQQSDSVIYIYTHTHIFFHFILFFNLWLLWVFVAARGLSLVAASRLLIVVASLVAEPVL